MKLILLISSLMWISVRSTCSGPISNYSVELFGHMIVEFNSYVVSGSQGVVQMTFTPVLINQSETYMVYVKINRTLLNNPSINDNAALTFCNSNCGGSDDVYGNIFEGYQSAIQSFALLPVSFTNISGDFVFLTSIRNFDGFFLITAHYEYMTFETVYLFPSCITTCEQEVLIVLDQAGESVQATAGYSIYSDVGAYNGEAYRYNSPFQQIQFKIPITFAGTYNFYITWNPEYISETETIAATESLQIYIYYTDVTGNLRVIKDYYPPGEGLNQKRLPTANVTYLGYDFEFLYSWTFTPDNFIALDGHVSNIQVSVLLEVDQYDYNYIYADAVMVKSICTPPPTTTTTTTTTTIPTTTTTVITTTTILTTTTTLSTVSTTTTITTTTTTVIGCADTYLRFGYNNTDGIEFDEAQWTLTNTSFVANNVSELIITSPLIRGRDDQWNVYISIKDEDLTLPVNSHLSLEIENEPTSNVYQYDTSNYSAFAKSPIIFENISGFFIPMGVHYIYQASGLTIYASHANVSWSDIYLFSSCDTVCDHPVTVVLDDMNENVVTTGVWSPFYNDPNYYNNRISQTKAALSSMTFPVKVPFPGDYNIYLTWVEFNNRANNTNVKMSYKQAVGNGFTEHTVITPFTIDQTIAPIANTTYNGRPFQFITLYTFPPSHFRDGEDLIEIYLDIVISAGISPNDKATIADAVMIKSVCTPTPTEPATEPVFTTVSVEPEPTSIVTTQSTPPETTIPAPTIEPSVLSSKKKAPLSKLVIIVIASVGGVVLFIAIVGLIVYVDSRIGSYPPKK